MTPVEIEVMLHYYYRTGDFPGFAEETISPSHFDAIQTCLHTGLLDVSPTQWRTDYRTKYGITEKGSSFVKSLMAVPSERIDGHGTESESAEYVDISPDQLEQAARFVCKVRDLPPDEPVDGTGKMVRWNVVAREVKAVYEVVYAVGEVVK